MENFDKTNAVTGAFSYTGKYITQRLLSMGEKAITITGHPDRPNPFGTQVKAYPFNFNDQKELVKNLQGVSTLYNTYWIRFSYGKTTFDKAVENTKILIRAAEEAGVNRIVHISITNASEESPFPYFRGKGKVEKAIGQSSLSYAIVRPTVLFGHEDILINNIAWLLRKFPLFVIPGSGDYKLQPVFVEDVADIAVEAGQHKENIIIDAAGPEIYSFNDMVKLIARTVHSKARIVHFNPKFGIFLSKFIGYFVNDVILTREEVYGLISNLLVSKNPPAGQKRLSDWLIQNANVVGTRYASELNRHFR